MNEARRLRLFGAYQSLRTQGNTGWYIQYIWWYVVTGKRESDDMATAVGGGIDRLCYTPHPTNKYIGGAVGGEKIK